MINYLDVFLSYRRAKMLKPLIIKEGPQWITYYSNLDYYYILRVMYHNGFKISYRNFSNQKDVFIMMKPYIPKTGRYFDTGSYYVEIPTKVYRKFFKHAYLIDYPSKDSNDFQHSGIKTVPFYIYPKTMTLRDIELAFDFATTKVLTVKFLKQFMPPFDPTEVHFWKYDHAYITASKAIINDEVDYNLVCQIEEEEFQDSVESKIAERYKFLSKKRFNPTDYEESVWGRQDRKWEELMKAQDRYNEMMKYEELNPSPEPLPFDFI